MHFSTKFEPKKCSICQRLRYCHERIRSTITELNFESGGTDIKSIAFGNKFPRNISEIHRCNTTKHASEVVPKNIDELKKQLNSIKSKPCENSTEIINKYISGTDKITKNMIGEDFSKNVNFTVLTANISYRDHQHDTIKKHSRVNKRFASVESVVRKLIYGSGKNNTKETGTSKITENKKPRTLGNVGDLKTVRTPNTQSKRVENSVGTNYFVEKISSSTKIENVSNRNKYTIRKSVRLPKSLNQGLNSTVMKIMPNGGKKVQSVGPRVVVPKPVIFKQYSKPAENPKKNRFDSCVGTELKKKGIPISKPKKQ
ncbi:hypothetical protein JTB14_003377 [Gonioctena quinquepunctata]|nr:hypothetical protein JTB14_003377 [Gonioctena quinquepunctata]